MKEQGGISKPVLKSMGPHSDSKEHLQELWQFGVTEISEAYMRG